MSDQADRITDSLKLFGLNPAEARVYVYLVKNSPRTALQISRDVQMARTKVYRIVEKLIEKGMVKEHLDTPGRKFEAEPYENLEYLLIDKESKIGKMRKALPKIYDYLQDLQLQSSTKSKTFFYKGTEGLKQITWNSLRAKKELYIYEISQCMHPFTGAEFAEKMREEFFLRKIITKQLTNIKHFEPFTNVEQYVKHCMRVRYIDPKDLQMNFEVLIYNDVVAIYTYKKELFGVEIYNADLAHMQKQLFRFVWKNSRKMMIGKGGEAWLGEKTSKAVAKAK